MSQVTLVIGKKVNEYLAKGTGNPVFVYPVTGTPEALAAFKAAQASYYREDEDGTPLYFSGNVIAEKTELVQSNSGKFSIKVNLEERVAKSEDLRAGYKAKFEAIQDVLGLSKEEMKKLLLEQMMA